jgi:hypothetical protein
LAGKELPEFSYSARGKETIQVPINNNTVLTIPKVPIPKSHQKIPQIPTSQEKGLRRESTPVNAQTHYRIIGQNLIHNSSQKNQNSNINRVETPRSLNYLSPPRAQSIDNRKITIYGGNRISLDSDFGQVKLRSYSIQATKPRDSLPTQDRRSYGNFQPERRSQSYTRVMHEPTSPPTPIPNYQILNNKEIIPQVRSARNLTPDPFLFSKTITTTTDPIRIADSHQALFQTKPQTYELNPVKIPQATVV